MKKQLLGLCLFLLLAHPGLAQRKPLVFSPDKEWHYIGIGTGLPLPTFLAYEYRLNQWSYAAEIGVIHTNILANIRQTKSNDPKSNYIRENLKQGASYTASLKYHFAEKVNSLYIGSQARLLKIGLKKDNPRDVINVFAPDRLEDIEYKLDNNRILNNVLGGKKFLDETDMQPDIMLMMIGISMGKNFRLSRNLIFETRLSIDFKFNQVAKLDFKSDSHRIDKILSNQISPYITKSIKNQDIMNVLPSLALSLKYALWSR